MTAPTRAGLAAAAAGALLLASLSVAWYEVAGEAGPRDLTPWDYLFRTDAALGLLALAAILAPAVLTGRRLGLAQAAVGVTAAAIVAVSLLAPPGDPISVHATGALGLVAALAIALAGGLQALGRTGGDALAGASHGALLAALLPAAFAIAVLYGIARSVPGLLDVNAPDLGAWGNAVSQDAQAVYLGERLFQDPAEGYTGLLYTPLFPAIVGVLDHIVFWRGWHVMVNLVSTVVLIGLIAGVAYRRVPNRIGGTLAAAAGALGIGALGWWGISALTWDMLFGGWYDHTAWALAFGGAIALAASLERRAWVGVAAVLLLTASIWAKQSAIVLVGVCGLWLLVGVALGRIDRRRGLLLAGGLTGANLLILAVANIVTGGWELYFNWLMGNEFVTGAIASTFGGHVRGVVREAWAGLGVLTLLLVALTGVLLVARGRGVARPPVAALLFPSTVRRRLAVLCAGMVVVGMPAAAYFRIHPGTFDNHYLGVGYALAFLIAIVYRASQVRPATAAAAAAVVGATFVLAEAVPRQASDALAVTVPTLDIRGAWRESPPEVYDVGERLRIYHPMSTDANVRSFGAIYPSTSNIADLMAVGREPVWWRRLLVERRFEAAAEFSFVPDQRYMTGGGIYEENYLWKLNEVVKTKYTGPGLPDGLRGREGPDPAPWMNACWGPFELAGASLGINRGGGFWCREGSVMRLRHTPAPWSDVRSREPVDGLAGEATVGLAQGSAALRLESGDRAVAVRVRLVDGRHEVHGVDGTTEAFRLRVAPGGDAVTLRFRAADRLTGASSDGRTVDVGVPRLDAPTFRFGAAAGSNAAIGLGGLRLGG